MIRSAAVFMLLMTACSRLASPEPMPVLPPPPKPLYSELKCLAWVVDSEARGEPPRGQRAVYDVVLHRMVVRSKTACEVVKEPFQFSGYKRGKALAVTPVMMTRLDKVSKMKPVAPRAEYFHATYVAPSWATRMKCKFKIGNHVFCEKPKPKEKHK